MKEFLSLMNVDDVLVFWSLQATVAALSTELEEARAQLEETTGSYGRELRRLQDSCADKQTCTDTALREVRQRHPRSIRRLWVLGLLVWWFESNKNTVRLPCYKCTLMKVHIPFN